MKMILLALALLFIAAAFYRIGFNVSEFNAMQRRDLVEPLVKPGLLAYAYRPYSFGIEEDRRIEEYRRRHPSHWWSVDE
jgi:hypothetical protein